MKVRSLKDLKQISRHIAQEREHAATEAQAQRQAQQQKEAEQQLFWQAVRATQPLRDHGRVVSSPAPVQPLPHQRQQDEQAVLRESLSDEFDPTTLLQTDDHLSYRQPSIGADVVAKLRRGQWTVQGQIDLHGLRVDEARQALVQFLRDAQRASWRCVRVVHGKGLGSPSRSPVLKAKVHAWLVQKKEVLAFVQARPLEGGAGALVVLLAAPALSN